MVVYELYVLQGFQTTKVTFKLKKRYFTCASGLAEVGRFYWRRYAAVFDIYSCCMKDAETGATEFMATKPIMSEFDARLKYYMVISVSQLL